MGVRRETPALRRISPFAGLCGDRFAYGWAIQRLLHLGLDSLASQRLLVFLAQEWVLQPVRNRRAAFGHIDRALVRILFTRHAGLVLAVIVGPVPADQAKRLLAD